MKLPCKYLLSSFIVVACCLLQQCCWGQSSTVRPYKFGFTIDEQQHRSEQRDERGIVMGEFGFITADGIYHVTVYATDEQGRFRILAMKNYPYESPPKTVEVMVKPKIPPTTTTTPKPLARHNFNTEACSGCFLTNGNNKPKGINGIEGKTGKSDIRPLSKSLSGPGSNSAANNNKNPATEFKDFTALQKAVKSQQLFSTTPSTLASNKVVAIALTMALNKVGSTTSTLAPNKDVSTTSTLAHNKIVTTPSYLAPTKVVSTTFTPASKKATTTLSFTTPSTLAPSLIDRIKSNNIPQHNAPLGKHELKDKHNNNGLKPLKTNAIKFLKQDLNTQTAAQERASASKTPSKDSLKPPFRQTSNTDTNTSQENTLHQTPFKSSVGGKVEQTLNKNTGKQAAQTTPTTNTLNKQYTTNPTVSKDTNQRTSKPLPASPGSGAAANTNTGTPPPIMDIIMQKVLPTLMGKKGPTQSSSTPTQSTSLNNKPNAVPSGSKNTGGSAGPATANGDGDLYRFKYILDYHGHTETGKRNGNKEGSYYSIGDDDVERTIEYVANEFGYQPRIRWRKLDRNEIKSKENTLKDYEFVWFNQ